MSALTDREAMVAKWIATGANNKAIAGRLHLSVRTVETHTNRIYSKCGITQGNKRVVLAQMMQNKESSNERR